MKEEVKKNIAHAFSIESKAKVRLEAYALKADKEGHPHLARLFRAVSNAKAIHSRRFLYLMRGKIGTTRENLRAALEAETALLDGLFPAMIQQAEGSSKAVRKAFIQSKAANGESTGLFERAMEHTLPEAETPYYVCQICGHIHLGSIPENCPICHAVPGRFKRIA